MNLGIVGDENIYLLNNSIIEWIEAKFIEIIKRAKPDWLVTYDSPGMAQLRHLLENLVEETRPDNLWDIIEIENLAPKRLVLVNEYYRPRHCEIALQDTEILAYTDYLVIFSNGQSHSKQNALRQGKVLEINYLERSEKWTKYN